MREAMRDKASLIGLTEPRALGEADAFLRDSSTLHHVLITASAIAASHHADGVPTRGNWSRDPIAKQSCRDKARDEHTPCVFHRRRSSDSATSKHAVTAVVGGTGFYVPDYTLLVLGSRGGPAGRRGGVEGGELSGRSHLHQHQRSR